MQGRIEFKGLKQFSKVARDVLRQASANTVNDIAKQTKTAVSKEVRVTYNIKAKRINKGTKLKKAKKNHPKAELKYIGRPLGLQNYGAKKTVRKGVTVKVLKAGGRKTVKGGFIPVTITGVYKRVGKERHPIIPLVGPSIPQMVKEKRIIKIANKIRRTKGQRIFDNQVKFLSAKKLDKLKAA